MPQFVVVVIVITQEWKVNRMSVSFWAIQQVGGLPAGEEPKGRSTKELVG